MSQIREGRPGSLFFRARLDKYRWREKFCHLRFLILVAVAQFSPQGLPNSRFWLHSRTRKCCPHGTVKPELLALRKNVKHLMPRGSIFDEKGINKIGKIGEGGEAPGR